MEFGIVWNALRRIEHAGGPGQAGWRRAFAIACLATCVVPGVHADDLCGATIVSDLKLDHDLICAADGLIVGADGIKIDLNGHTIAGSGSGIGIAITGRTDVSIAAGTVRNFAVGVRTNTSSDVEIKRMEFVENAEGIDLQAESFGNTIKNNAFRDSSVRAIMLRSNARDNDIKNNTFTGNRIGVLVFGGVENTLKHNLFSGSSLAGIRLNVIATGNVVKNNELRSNTAGIEFLVTPTGSSTGNEFKGNTIAINGCGLKGPTAGNAFKNNSFEGNVTDTCL